LDLPGVNGPSHKKVVEKMSKKDEKKKEKLVWWPVLEVLHCKKL